MLIWASHHVIRCCTFLQQVWKEGAAVNVVVKIGHDLHTFTGVMPETSSTFVELTASTFMYNKEEALASATVSTIPLEFQSIAFPDQQVIYSPSGARRGKLLSPPGQHLGWLCLLPLDSTT
jgi:hypothetical protein